MSFGAYISSVYTLLGLAGLVVTCAFAWWKGGPPERMGTLILAVEWIGADVARGFSNQMVPIAAMFGSDIFLAIGFLFVAIRYSSLWLGAAMILQSATFALHAFQMSSSDEPRWHGWIVYLLAINLVNYAVLLTLTGGTIATIRRRVRMRREKAAAEAKAAERDAILRAPTPPPEAAL